MAYCGYLPILALFPTLGFAQTEGVCIPTGGKPALDRLFEQELVYPAVAKEAGIKGETVITLRLGPDGVVRTMEVGRPLCPECDAEALRVVRMVRWKPATAGEACTGKDVYLSVPFEPGKARRWERSRHPHSGGVFELPADTALMVHGPKQLDTQIAPGIPGGMSGLPTYIGREMRYPAEAFRYSLDGTVKLEFIVEPTGSISNMQVIEDVGGGCTDEAMRLLYKIPWSPGVKNDRRVRSVLQVSIRFDLPKRTR